MKFGKNLAFTVVPEWSQYYLRYNNLKYLIKSYYSAIIRKEKTLEVVEKLFFNELAVELSEVNRFYDERLRVFEKNLKNIIEKSLHITIISKHSHEAILSFLVAINEFKLEGQKLLSYVNVNYDGFRKILKKFDSRFNEKSGFTYLEQTIKNSSFNNKSHLNELLVLAEETSISLNSLYSNPARVGNPSFIISDELHYLVKNDDIDGLKTYLEKVKLSENDLQHLFSTLMKICSQKCAFNCLRYIISMDVDLNEADEVTGKSTIHHLAIQGNDEIMDIFLKENADINRSDVFGRTPLHYASINGHTACVKLLLENHAICNTEDFQSYSALFYAVLKGHTECVQLFLSDERFGEIVHKGSSVKMDNIHENYMNSLISDITISGADNDHDRMFAVSIMPSRIRKETLLALACMHGHAIIAKQLILHGFDVNFVDEVGETPLHHSCRMSFINCVELLLENGALVNVSDKILGWTPLFYSACNGDYKILQLLLEHGSDTLHIDLRGWSSLDNALYRGQHEVSKLLKNDISCKQEVLNSVVRISDSFSSDNFKELTNYIKSNERYVDHSTILDKRIYGHKYLQNQCMVLIYTSSNDIRNPFEFVQLNDSTLENTQSLTLRLVAKEETMVHEYEFDWHAKESQDCFTFFASHISKFELNIDLVLTFRKSAVLARALILPSSFSCLNGQINVPLINAGLEAVGIINFKFLVITPFLHSIFNNHVGSFENYKTYWKSISLIGHRGAGAESAAKAGQFRRSHINENTVLSFVTAASLGAEYVEFDVQLTKDNIPIVHHDWTVHNGEFDIPVSLISSKIFKNLKRNASSSQLIDKQPFSNRLQRSHSLKYDSLLNWESDTPSSFNFSIGLSSKNESDLSIKTPYSTLEEAFKNVPNSLGFNIELKYPDKIDIEGHCLQVQELNLFVDAILNCIFDHAGNRNIILSSFSPDICLALNWKQPVYPVLLLSDAGIFKSSDPRWNSLQAALRFAKNYNLFGIVTNSSPLLDALPIIKHIKESGLVLLTYGECNNDINNVKLQQKHGIDAVIVDHVAHIRKGLTSES